MKVMIFASMFLFFACSANDGNIPAPNQQLTDTEQEDLQFMREEEKLARDVYLYAYEQYNLNIFQNIAQSEGRHMDATLQLIEKYGLTDPVVNDHMGTFANPDLSALYTTLTAQVDESLEAALLVGATIEDLDIRDLNVAISHTDKADIIEVYSMLNCGSKNHIRAYVSQLENRGGQYIPQYISVESYNEILGGAHEHCGQ